MESTAKLTKNAPTSALVAGVKSLYISGIYSDLTIVCGDGEFKVHKNILHLQSPYFRKMLSGKYMEAEQNTITLHDDNPTHMATLLHYIYYFTYFDGPRIKTINATSPIESETEYAVHIYAIADKYDVPPLRDLATTKLSNTFLPHPTNISSVIATINLVDTSPPTTFFWRSSSPNSRIVWAGLSMMKGSLSCCRRCLGC